MKKATRALTKVAHEDVRGVRAVAADSEQLDQVVQLTVDVPADGGRPRQPHLQMARPTQPRQFSLAPRCHWPEEQVLVSAARDQNREGRPLLAAPGWTPWTCSRRPGWSGRSPAHRITSQTREYRHRPKAWCGEKTAGWEPTSAMSSVPHFCRISAMSGMSFGIAVVPVPVVVPVPLVRAVPSATALLLRHRHALPDNLPAGG